MTQAIDSLERFKVMSENTQGNLEPTTSRADDEVPFNNPVTAPGEQSNQAEAPTDVMEEAATSAEQARSPEASLPPEAQGETNGGPLGCCLGVMIGLLLSLSLAILSRVFAAPLGSVLQGNYGLLGILVRILMGILAVVFAILFGYLGWKLGRRFYREYEPPVIKERPRRARAKKIS